LAEESGGKLFIVGKKEGKGEKPKIDGFEKQSIKRRKEGRRKIRKLGGKFGGERS